MVLENITVEHFVYHKLNINDHLLYFYLTCIDILSVDFLFSCTKQHSRRRCWKKKESFMATKPINCGKLAIVPNICKK